MTDQSVIKRNRRPAARPAEILTAALDLFAEKGFSATRMEDVARRAGLSKGAVYLYFTDKTALLTAIVETTIANELKEVGARASLAPGPVAPVITEAARHISRRLTETRLPEILKLIIAESGAHPELASLYFDHAISVALPLFEGLIRRGVATGEFRPVEPAYTARSLAGGFIFSALWRSVFEPIGKPALDIPAFAEHHITLILKGLAP